MSFRIINGDHEVTLPLPFDAHVESLLHGLIGRVEPGTPAQIDLSRRIVDVISAMIENNVIPPTDKQVKYAVAIARELSLQLPADVLQFRDAMTVFLGTHAETYRRRKEIPTEGRR